MDRTTTGLRIGFVEPHLGRFGGIRRVVEFGNRLVSRGHSVSFYVPDGVERSCGWMECLGEVVWWSDGFGDELDVLVFNHEPHWHVVERFERVRARVFYALHFSGLYGKEGSWEALWAPVDLVLANSGWTADRVGGVTGVRPLVQLGGANRDVFCPPVERVVRWPVLCSGVEKWWKGTDTIREACLLLGVPLEGYSGWDLSQPELGAAVGSAGVFVVGSLFEGFCQPGLEALACGTPLVTTDNGGCLEYAIDGETALVVPPDDPEAMAEAIGRLLADPKLGERLSVNGLGLVADVFDWERRTDELVERFDGVVAGTLSVAPPPRPEAPVDPVVSVVVLAWDNLLLTQRFVESVRQHTDVAYELIIVDNGSEWEAAHYASVAGDKAVLNETNLGFAKGMNQGLAVAAGEWVAFCNNDTELPVGWASSLLDAAASQEAVGTRVGVVVPALTASNNPATVRDTPGETVEVVAPFSAPPAAVLYLMRRELVEGLGGWGEEYEIASGEDVDLGFKVWCNDHDFVYDSRVLVKHISKGTATRLDDWQALWAKNRQRFLDKWMSTDPCPRLDTCPPARHTRNRATAQATAEWMHKYFRTRARAEGSDAARQSAEAKLAEVKDRPVPVVVEPTRQAMDASPNLSGMSNEIVRIADGSRYLLDGGRARLIRSLSIATALEAQFGACRDIGDKDLKALPAGPPVEILSPTKGQPFIVLGGFRHPVRGLPHLRRISTQNPTMELMESFPIDLGRVPKAPPVPPTGTESNRKRTSRAHRLLRQLARSGATDGSLTRGPNGRVYLLEGNTSRVVASGLLAAALVEDLGEPKQVTKEEIAKWDPGPPVEVMEGPDGVPFVVIAGKRRPLRGLPEAADVSAGEVASFGVGGPLDIAKANRPRRQAKPRHRTGSLPRKGIGLVRKVKRKLVG